MKRSDCFLVFRDDCCLILHGFPWTITVSAGVSVTNFSKNGPLSPSFRSHRQRHPLE